MVYTVYIFYLQDGRHPNADMQTTMWKFEAVYFLKHWHPPARKYTVFSRENLTMAARTYIPGVNIEERRGSSLCVNPLAVSGLHTNPRAMETATF
jgi:hypothetical protein